VGAWGYFLWQGVMDPLGGINSLWPLFGIANQLLACVALVVATTILLKMGRLRWIWVTLLPMTWLVTITMTASYEKIFDGHLRIGFLAQAHSLQAQIASGTLSASQIQLMQRLIFNNRLDAVVTGTLAVMVLILLIEAIGEWIAILRGTRPAVLHEARYVATQWASGD
jgi:carbon starvation protein